MAGQRFLVPYVRVRLLPPQPLRFQSAYVAPSSSGLGRRPLKAEVEGSNPFGATKKQQARACALAFFFPEGSLLCNPQPGFRPRALLARFARCLGFRDIILTSRSASRPAAAKREVFLSELRYFTRYSSSASFSLGTLSSMTASSARESAAPTSGPRGIPNPMTSRPSIARLFNVKASFAA